MPLALAFGGLRVFGGEMSTDPQVGKLLAVLVARLPGMGGCPR